MECSAALRLASVAVILTVCGEAWANDGDTWAERRAAAVNRARPLVYNTDGCDMLYWPSNLPVSVENFTGRRLRFVPGTHVSTVSYCPQSAGFGHFTCRQAGEPLTGTVPHPNGGRFNSAAAFFALGTDSLRMATEFCVTNGLERFVSIRVNDQHDAASKPGKLSALYPQFKIDHPECLMGALDPESPRRKELYKGYVGWSCVNFDCELVRETMKKFVRELVTNYDVDGIEYDFNRHFMLFRSVATGGVATRDEIAKMTQLMRDLKAITEEVGRKKGRPIVIAMRMPDSVDYDLAVGADIVTWFKEKLVDIWIGGGYFLLNPVNESVELAHRYGIRFYWSLDESRIPSQARKRGNPILPGRMSEAFYAARYSAAQAAGCDGVYLFNLEDEPLRQMASIDPRDTHGRDKIYFAVDRGSGGYTPNSWLQDGERFSTLPRIDPNRPLPVGAGECFSFSLFLGDDFGGDVKVSVRALTSLTQGSLVLTANGRTFEEAKSSNGVYVFAVPKDVLHAGSNAFSVTFPAAGTLNDFSVSVRVARAKAKGCADALTPVPPGDVKVLGHIGDVQRAFFENRIFSDFARDEIWKEAREAFAHPDDDVFNRPMGMWKGEFWGKLMISACRVAAYAHDEELKRFLHDEALRLLAYQQPDGYLGTYVNKDWVTPPDPDEVQRVLNTRSAFNWNIWCRKYTLWGLLACYRLTGDRRILEAADRATEQMIAGLRRQGLKIADTGTLAMRGLPPCSILKPILWLYEETGKEGCLAFAREIYGSWSDPTCRAPQFADKLATGRPIQDWYPEENGYWGKAYEMMSCMAGMVELSRVTGDRAPLGLAVSLCDRICTDERNLCRSVGYNDQFWGAARQLNGVSEPCDAIHWIRLNHELWLATGEAKYVDAIEETFYNALLASISADRTWGARCIRSHGRHQKAPPQSGMRLQHCCVNNLPRGLMDAAQTIAARDAKGVLHVALYHDAAVTCGGDRVSLSGGFPVGNEVILKMERRQRGKVRLRLPAWCRRMSVRNANGDEMVFTAPGWNGLDAPAGASEWKLVFDMNPRIIESVRKPVERYAKSSPLVRRWARNKTGPDGEADLMPLLRTKPAAQVMYGPLLLAKSVRLGATERELTDPETVNGNGWRLSVEPCEGADVWGCWDLVFEKDGLNKRVRACDYASAAIWSSDKIEFSTFF